MIRGRLMSTLVALLVAGCANDEPASPDPFLKVAGPKGFESFELKDGSGQVVWRLSADPPAPVTDLFYGQVPAGFRQEVPSEGRAPRPLVIGEQLWLESITRDRVFRHQGHAESGSRFWISHWETRLRYGPPPPEDTSLVWKDGVSVR